MFAKRYYLHTLLPRIGFSPAGVGRWWAKRQKTTFLYKESRKITIATKSGSEMRPYYFICFRFVGSHLATCVKNTQTSRSWCGSVTARMLSWGITAMCHRTLHLVEKPWTPHSSSLSLSLFFSPLPPSLCLLSPWRGAELRAQEAWDQIDVNFSGKRLIAGWLVQAITSDGGCEDHVSFSLEQPCHENLYFF